MLPFNSPEAVDATRRVVDASENAWLCNHPGVSTPFFKSKSAEIPWMSKSVHLVHRLVIDFLFDQRWFLCIYWDVLGCLCVWPYSQASSGLVREVPKSGKPIFTGS